jgi:hypothetical protein
LVKEGATVMPAKMVTQSRRVIFQRRELDINSP